MQVRDPRADFRGTGAQMRVNDDEDAGAVTPFGGYGLSAEVLQAVEELGYEAPTPIQAQTIPLLMAGRDVIAQAQTGTGKTAAFGIPIVERVDPAVRAPQALVLAPTRELAVQVAEAIHRLGRGRRVTVLPIYGGQPIDRQLRALRHGVQVVVGTPGRVMDHLRRETISLAGVRLLVLDEADRMLDMGFIEDVEYILQHLPAERQTALFSATMPGPVAALGRRQMREPERVQIEKETVTVPQTRQIAYEVSGRNKLDSLARILDAENPASAIVFCRTKREVDELAESLQARGYLAEPIHGDLSQRERDAAMARFRQGQAELLIATDVAARGLDIPDVTHVINYDIPMDPESYIHRIGRTGRAGRAGEAVTLVEPRERRQLRMIEKLIGRRLTPGRIPSVADVARRRRERFKKQVAEAIEGGELEAQLVLVEELGEEYEATEIAAAALKLLAEREKEGVRVEPMDGDGAGVEPGMTRLFLGAGRKDGIRPLDVVGAIANEAGLPGRQVGTIDILDHVTFVEVPEEAAARVIAAMRKTTLRGRRVKVESARPRG
jgi:ATP-dependent RNA helicase DeaD